MDKEQSEYKGISTKQGVVVTILVLLGLTITYLNFKNEINKAGHTQRLYNQAVEKADKNNDNQLQRNELADLLNSLNPGTKIPTARDFSIRFTDKKTYSDNANLYLGINDLEAYVNNN